MSDQPIMLGNRYRLDEIIGRGGMAEVWRAWDTRLGRDVAVKRLRADLATDPIFQARFKREAQSAAGLNHPNIVAVYDTGSEIDANSNVDIPYIVMELVQGTTLRDLLRDGRQILPQRALEFTAGVLDALAYSHRRGIVHRDIKPANVMLTTAGRIKVMDFGIARAVADTSATMTQTAAVIGTAQYLSPEQARGETVDTRSDIYSVGCLMYELLTSRPPFTGDSPVSVAYQHVREQPVPPSHVDPELTPEEDVVTLTALEKNPDDRYQTAEAMREDISRLLAGHAPMGAQIQPEDPAETRVLTDRPAPGAHPRRGFTEALPPSVTSGTNGTAVIEDDADFDETNGGGLLPLGATDGALTPPARRFPALLIGIIALVVVLLATGGVVAYQLLKPPPEPTTVPVPNVVKMTQYDAQQAIGNVQLNGVVENTYGPADTKGTVIRQTPDPDTPVLLGSTVTIYVNQGPQMGTIPFGIVGLTESEAKRLLQSNSFTNIPPAVTAELGTLEPADYVAGQVLSVQPVEGSTAPLDGEVTLKLATGKSIVDNLKGMTEANARALLVQRGFQDANIVVTLQESATDPAGTVISQKPEAGTYEFRTNKIWITVATAPPPPPPPPPPPTSDTPTPPATTPTEQVPTQ